MPQMPNFVGPSYDLDSKPASVQRTINLIPVPQEPGNERTTWVFKDAPGLEAWATLPTVDLGWLTAVHDYTSTPVATNSGSETWNLT